MATSDEVDEWRAVLEGMRREWAETVQVAAERRFQRARDGVRGWEARLRRMREEQGDLRQRTRWYQGRPDLLGILGDARREAYHQRILAWLLDPAAPTGLEEPFLLRFVRLLAGSPERSRVIEPSVVERELHAVRVEREVVGPQARTDLMVRGESFTIIIEIKVDAGEGPKQCERIFQDHRDRPEPHFVFLTPAGDRPETVTGDSADVFVRLSFRQVREELGKALSVGPTTRSGWHPPGDLDPLQCGLAACLNYLETLRREIR